MREEIKNTGYNKYRSSTIASDVSDETVAYVEEMQDVLKGVEIASETVRYYPKGKLLSHVLGYMGSISDSQYDEYVKEKGYSAGDLIGKDGIEASMESKLRGTDGIKSILVNSAGDYVETVSQTEPVAGKDVYLTIEVDLQKAAEKSLRNCIKAVQTGGVYKSKYGNRSLRKYANCASGAVVAIDVETADILAMASYPNFVPNIFAEGISTKDWASVQSTNPRDSLAPTPLYNIATSSAVQPGPLSNRLRLLRLSNADSIRIAEFTTEIISNSAEDGSDAVTTTAVWAHTAMKHWQWEYRTLVTTISTASVRELTGTPAVLWDIRAR